MPILDLLDGAAAHHMGEGFFLITQKDDRDVCHSVVISEDCIRKLRDCLNTMTGAG